MFTSTSPGYPLRLDGAIDPDLDRWPWLVKWFLAVPHLVVLAFLWTATIVLTVVAGVAILFTGSYPRRIFDFNVGVLRWTWRVAFYAYWVLGTDQYPPFSLQPDHGYPADLAVDHPGALSRPMVLVKPWLLALPHVVIAALLVGVPGWAVQELPWSLLAGGVLGLLTLAAMLVLTVSGRYPESLFDIVMGLNRWVFRALAYVLLMTDEYPPFRLDVGAIDPGTTEPAVRRTSTRAPVTPDAERRAGVILTIVGVVLVVLALLMWWLVMTTNTEGDPGDPQLLPLLAAIPLAIGIYKIIRARARSRPASERPAEHRRAGSIHT